MCEENKKKCFLSRLMEKLDKKMQQCAQKKSCCRKPPEDKSGDKPCCKE